MMFAFSSIHVRWISVHLSILAFSKNTSSLSEVTEISIECTVLGSDKGIVVFDALPDSAPGVGWARAGCSNMPQETGRIRKEEASTKEDILIP